MYKKVRIYMTALALIGVSTSAISSDIAFGYDCIDCPSAWSNVDTGDKVNNCAGPAQSPIAISNGDGKRGPLPRLNVSYGSSVVLTEEALLTNIEWLDGSNLSSIQLGRSTFDFLQFHFHSTAEHVVNGERSPLEMHFVNQAADGSLAVLAVFIEAGSHNPGFEPILSSIGSHQEGNVITVDLDDLLPGKLHSFRYIGSTTTPPCVAGVQWILLKQPIQLSVEQIAAVQGEIRGLNHGFDNNRTIQNREYREISTDARRYQVYGDNN